MRRSFPTPMRVLIGGVLLLVALKLWLVHTEEIIGSATRFDAVWFVRSAQHWYWGAPYDWLTFMRPCAYPLWLASVHFAGVPQRLAIELLQLGGFATLVFALHRAGISVGLNLLLFAAAAFHPSTFAMNNYTMADTFYAALLPYAFGAMIFTFLSANILAAAGAGVVLGVLWNTREESCLLVLMILAFCAIWVRFERAKGIAWRAAFLRIFPSALAMIATLAIFVFGIYAVNFRTFHAFARSELSSRSFESAMTALLRIQPRDSQRFVPITSESLRIASRVSPTFARLQGPLNGGVGDFWRAATLQGPPPIAHEIILTLMPWAIREAAGAIGQHESGAKADRFYKNIGREIDLAARDGRAPSRPVVAAFLTSPVQNAVFVTKSFCRIARLFAARYEFSRERDDAILSPQEKALYDEVADRTPASTRIRVWDRAAIRVEDAIGHHHRSFAVALALTGLLSVAISRFRVFRKSDAISSCVLLFLFVIGCRVLFFTGIDAVGWPCAFERFVYPVLPLSSMALILLIAHAFTPGPDDQIAARETFKQRANEPGNSLDFLRFVFASAVILSHSFPLLHGPNYPEPLLQLTGQITMGGTAVAGFFVLSGYLVLQSWLRSRGLVDYLRKRVLRIYPGFVVACLACALIFGPLGSADARAYFHRVDLRQFLFFTSILHEPELSGVFPNTPFPNLVNGALWTIKWEFCCYLLVPILAAVGALRSRVALTAVFVAFAGALGILEFGHFMSVERSFVIFGGPAYGWLRAGAFFLSGMCFYTWRHALVRHGKWLIAAAIASILFVRWFDLALLSAGVYLLFYVGYSRNRILQNWSRPGDFSYGLYLYSWPVQQLISQRFGGRLTTASFFLISFVVTALFAIGSWYAVERPFLRLKRTALAIDAGLVRS